MKCASHASSGLLGTTRYVVFFLPWIQKLMDPSGLSEWQRKMAAIHIHTSVVLIGSVSVLQG